MTSLSVQETEDCFFHDVLASESVVVSCRRWQRSWSICTSLRSSEPTDDSSVMDIPPGQPSASDRPVPSSPSQPVDTSASVASAVVRNIIAASGRQPVSGNVSWPPASSGAAAAPPAAASPPQESFLPSVKPELKRTLLAHIAHKAQRSSQIPGWTSDRVITNEEAPSAIQKLLVIVEHHADLLDKLGIEAGCLNS